MKRLITLLILSVGINLSYAQFDENNAIYATGELSLGNYMGLDINLNYVYKERYSFKIGYSFNSRDAKSLPRNYSSGLLVFKPNEHFENYQISIGVIKINQNGKIRLNASIGLGYTIVTELDNWERVNRATLGPNYTWDYKKHNAVSLIINPKIEFPFTRFYGFTISPMVQITKGRTYFGIGIGQMIGLLRKRRN